MLARAMASLFLLGLLTCVPINALAQERSQQPQRADTAQVQPPMQEMGHQQQEMQQQMRAMMPMMSTMLQNLTQSMMAALADPQTAQNLAKFIRNYYEALVAQGFTREEALRIVTSVGLPALPSL